jgi:drug/metabolite transporter (DMT)-like permease
MVAGLSAALSSVFGKLAFDSHIIPHWLHKFTPWILEALSDAHQEYLLLGMRGFSFVMIFLSNVIMINLFVKSMNMSTTSEAVVVNTACNFFFTALFGWMLFNEPLPGMWWVGATLIILGVLMIVRSSKGSQQDKPKKKQE